MTSYPLDSAAARGLTGCTTCGRLCLTADTACLRCGSAIRARIDQSVPKTLALLLTALILYVPANVLPIMRTEQIGDVQTNTILSGVVQLWEHGSYVIAAIIFLASVFVPMAKIFTLIWLCWSVSRKRHTLREQRARLFRITETVGRWSMIDVFVVSVLVAMVQLGNLLSIHPGPAALAFAGVVLLTMLAAASFDSRLIWDSFDPSEDSPSNEPSSR